MNKPISALILRASDGRSFIFTPMFYEGKEEKSTKCCGRLECDAWTPITPIFTAEDELNYTTTSCIYFEKLCCSLGDKVHTVARWKSIDETEDKPTE